MLRQLHSCRRRVAIALLLSVHAAVIACAPAVFASTRKVQQIVSPAGIKAWLVEEHSIPLVSIRFAFSGGAALDPLGKEGLATLMSSLLSEGAGTLDAAAFARQLADQGANLSVSGNRDRIVGGLDVLSKRFAPSAGLLRLALSSPRFDAAALRRVRIQRISDLEIAAKEPRGVSLTRWYAEAFPSHLYGRPIDGTPESVRRISRDDVKTLHRKVFARDTLKVVIVGDIGRTDAIQAVDAIFGGLSVHAEFSPLSRPELRAIPEPVVVRMDQPLATATFGFASLPTDHPDYPALQVLNQIIGSGDFDATLMEEIRVKRGLAYAVQTSLMNDTLGSVLLGGMATSNENMGKALALLKQVLTDTATRGPTDEQFENAKLYLVGSFVLDFDTNSKLAGSLLKLWLDGKAPDFLDERNAAIERVSLADVKRVAQEILNPERLLVTIVGQPNLGQ